MSNPQIVCMGEPLVEFNQVDEKGHYLRGHGGDTSNCAIAAARAGAAVGYVTALGEDEFGDSFMRLWAENGVDASQVTRDSQAHTGIYFVTHGGNGHVFSYLRAGSAASRMGPHDLPRSYIENAEILHVSGISMAISASASDAVLEAVQIARRANTKVSFDTNLRLKLWPLERARALIGAAMRMTDIALPGLEDAEQLTGLSEPDAIADHYLEQGAGIVALTLGKDGCLVATPDERRRVPGTRVEAVDATAAGDTFDGNFLAEFLAHDDPFRAARFANAAAALSTRGYGAVAPMPMRQAVLDALATEGAR
ncbi:sugar kinase [Chelativorans salis]|uniref:Sugar kinase n=1 Tax=Chelativorans salis TaxID=2978478 RepID=A0ABT2LQ24_9HYPH|nr:sugar kinase [Chelativorans sp. EGI FJ00035]MCT7376657.1 sugar kinase [Chelativorans sp. EGI FJ00035]